MLAITHCIDRRLPLIEVLALGAITALFLGVAVHLLRHTSPMPAAKVMGAFLATGAILTTAVLAHKILHLAKIY